MGETRPGDRTHERAHTNADGATLFINKLVIGPKQVSRPIPGMCFLFHLGFAE